MLNLPTLNRAALASAGRFVAFAALAAGLAAATGALPGLNLAEPYNTIVGLGLATAAKYVEAHRRTR